MSAIKKLRNRGLVDLNPTVWFYFAEEGTNVHDEKTALEWPTFISCNRQSIACTYIQPFQFVPINKDEIRYISSKKNKLNHSDQNNHNLEFNSDVMFLNRKGISDFIPPHFPIDFLGFNPNFRSKFNSVHFSAVNHNKLYARRFFLAPIENYLWKRESEIFSHLFQLLYRKAEKRVERSEDLGNKSFIEVLKFETKMLLISPLKDETSSFKLESVLSSTFKQFFGAENTISFKIKKVTNRIKVRSNLKKGIQLHSFRFESCYIEKQTEISVNELPNELYFKLKKENLSEVTEFLRQNFIPIDESISLELNPKNKFKWGGKFPKGKGLIFKEDIH